MLVCCKKFDNFYLCEAIPMLLYLGADCSINEETGCFQVLMPMITFWEAFMPDYLHYHFNTEEIKIVPLIDFIDIYKFCITLVTN